jgi:glycosyltransferase involved in cell wall biosynthesis
VARITQLPSRALRKTIQAAKEAVSLGGMGVGLARLSITGRAAAAGGRRILVVDDLLPDPRFGAGYPRAHEIVLALVAAGWAVCFYPMESTDEDLARMRAAFPHGVTFVRGEGPGGLRRLLQSRVGRFDIAIVSRPRPMRGFNGGLRRIPKALAPLPFVYDAEAIVSTRDARRRELFGNPWTRAEHDQALDREIAITDGADAIFSVSETDADAFRVRVDIPVFTLSHVARLRPGAAPFEARRNLLFVGRLAGDRIDSPNVDSMVWFVEEVMPILDGLIGTDYALEMAGMVESAAIVALARDRVIVHGAVDDLAEFYARSRLFLAPTRFAAGISLKIVEAIGYGIPCVVTPLIADQLALKPDEVLIGGSAQAFAEQCARLYTDPRLWADVRAKALQRAEDEFSEAAFGRKLISVLDEIIAAKAS